MQLKNAFSMYENEALNKREMYMEIVIKNPNSDLYGNSKENIFLAFSQDDTYLGSSFVYPNLNQMQIIDIPFLIFIDVIVEGNLGTDLHDKVRQKLFNKVYTRAINIRNERMDLNARIYSGFGYDIDKMNFYIQNGFHEDYSIVMEANLPVDFKYTLPNDFKVSKLNIKSNEEIDQYTEIYNKIFVSPLDIEEFNEQGKNDQFLSTYLKVSGQICGGCTIYLKNGIGYIETMYVLPEFRGKGISKIIMNYIFNYFISVGVNISQLEVWKLSKRAVALYESYGYTEVKKKLMFPGITL